MRIYISGPLQGSSDLVTARHLYESIAKALGAVGHEPYVPHLHTDPERAVNATPETVFHTDLSQLMESQVIVAHIGEPSTGVGAELAIASQADKRIIAVKRINEIASRFALGLVLAAGGQVISFEDDAYVGEQVVELLAQPTGDTPTA